MAASDDDVAKVRAKYQARRGEIEVGYQAHCEELRRPWNPSVDPYLLALIAGDGKVVMSLDEAAVERERLLRQADEDELRELKLIKRRRGPGEVDHRDPIPVPQLTDAGRLRDEPFTTISKATGLSTRKIGYVKKAFKYRDLTWDDKHDCLGPVPEHWNTPEGIRLPAR